MSHIEGPPPPGGFGGTGPDEELPHLDVPHELGEVNVRALVNFGVGMFVVVGIVAVLMWGLLGMFQREAARNDPTLSPIARPDVQMPPSQVGNPFFGPPEGPQLLTSEPAVLAKQRQSEAEALGAYGWVNEKTGVVRIPIAEAKKLILQRGLPVRSEGVVDATLGARRAAYGESSGGRTLTGAPAQEAPAKEEGTAAPAAQPSKGHGH